MFDHVFSAVLAFLMLTGGTLAMGSAMLERPKASIEVVQLPMVTVIGKRAASEAHVAQSSPALPALKAVQ